MRKLASFDAYWNMLLDPVRQALGCTTRVPTIAGAQILVNNISMLESRKYMFFGSQH